MAISTQFSSDAATTAAAVRSRPWARSASDLEQKVQDSSPHPWCVSGVQDIAFSTRIRPWNNVASRLAEALADFTDDEETLPVQAVQAVQAVQDDVTNCMITALADFTDDEDEEETPPECTGQDSDRKPLQPSARGGRQCLCQGEVLIMFGHYGWLSVHDEIDHPATNKNGGRIYVSARDIVNNITLVEGDRVTFYLYVDDEGLGAEDCRLQGWEADRVTHNPGLNPNASAFIPTDRPSAQQECVGPWLTHSFVRPNPNVFAINEAYWSDDSDDESVAIEWDCDGDVESSREFSKDRFPDVRRARRRGALKAGMRRVKAKSSSHDSSSTGFSSGSESSDGRRVEVLKMPPPPPGLGGPTDFTPPPGLIHPEFEFLRQ